MPRSSDQKPRAGHPVEGRHQRGRPVDHGRVDHLAPARLPGLHQGAHHPEGQVHAAAPEVADEVERRHRGLAPPSDAVQRSGQRDVVQVVARGHRVGAVLAPAGHPAVHQARVAGQAVLGADPQPLGHPGPEPLQQGVGSFDQRQHGLDPLGRLEVDADRAPASVQEVSRRVVGVAAPHRRGSIDSHDVGAHVGQHHGAERPRPDARDLYDPDSRQRSHDSSSARRLSARQCTGGPGTVRGRGMRRSPSDEG